jgi:O-antigen ligase
MLRTTVIAAIIVPILASTVLVHNMSWAAERFGDTDTAESRFISGYASLKMIWEKPWFGWGYSNYNLYAPQFQTRIGDIPYNRFHTSHNTWLTIIVEMGLVGFLMYELPGLYWLTRSVKAWQRLPRDGFWSRHLLAVLWLATLNQFIVCSFNDMLSSDQFGTTIGWMTLGLIATLAYSHPKLDR